MTHMGKKWAGRIKIETAKPPSLWWFRCCGGGGATKRRKVLQAVVTMETLGCDHGGTGHWEWRFEPAHWLQTDTSTEDEFKILRSLKEKGREGRKIRPTDLTLAPNPQIDKETKGPIGYLGMAMHPPPTMPPSCRAQPSAMDFPLGFIRLFSVRRNHACHAHAQGLTRRACGPLPVAPGQPRLKSPTLLSLPFCFRPQHCDETQVELRYSNVVLTTTSLKLGLLPSFGYSCRARALSNWPYSPSGSECRLVPE
jgi:hypothetical protein